MDSQTDTTIRFRDTLVVLVVLAAVVMLGTCGEQPNPPEEALTIEELLVNSLYDTEVEVYGQIEHLGDFFCSCFELSSDGDTLVVWYDTMSEDDGTARPEVSLGDISNGSWVVVTGELKTAGLHNQEGDFWANNIVRVR